MPTGVQEQHALRGDSATRECSPGVSQPTSSSSREEHLLTMDKQVLSTSLSPPTFHHSSSRLKCTALRSTDTLLSPVGNYIGRESRVVWYRRWLHLMNKCTRGATLHMSSTKLLVHTIGTVKFDLPQSTLETQLRVWACCWWTTV